MSTTAACNWPYWAGRAPVMKFSECAKRPSSAWPNTASPSGSSTPSSRYCTSLWSPRTWIWPKLSCATPGACSSTALSGALLPWGILARTCGEKLVMVAPRLGWIRLRASFRRLAVTTISSVLEPLAAGAGGEMCGDVWAATRPAETNTAAKAVDQSSFIHPALQTLCYNIPPSDRPGQWPSRPVVLPRSHF